MNRQEKDEQHSSPVYEAGRKSWNERWMVVRDSARGWRYMSFLMAGVAAVSVVQITHLSSQAKVVPFVVEVNKLGESVAAYRVEQSIPSDPRVIKAQLARWVVDMRTVYADSDAQRERFMEGYAWIDAGSQADRVFVEWYSGHADRERAKDDTVRVEIETVSPESPSSWRVNWREQKYNLKGELDGPPTYYYAVMGVSITPPTSDAAILANPSGLFIETLQWGDRPGGRGTL